MELNESEVRSKPASFDISGDIFLDLVAKIFLGSSPARSLSVVSCDKFEGTSFVSQAIQASLVRHFALDARVMEAEKFMPDVQEKNLEERIVCSGRVITLVDCPALFSSSAAIRTAPYVDGMLLVVEDGRHSKAQIQRAVSMIDAVQGQVLGIVLNRWQNPLPQWVQNLAS